MFVIDIFGKTDLIAQEIPSAVGMRGFCITGHGDFDWHASKVAAMLRAGQIRPASLNRPPRTRTGLNSKAMAAVEPGLKAYPVQPSKQEG